MTSARRDGLYLLLLGSLTFILLGGALQLGSPVSMVDFRVVYYPARCLIHHHDPYLEEEVLRQTQAEGGNRSSDTAATRQIVTRYEYPPSAFAFTVPFALLPWGPAHLLWMALTVGTLLLAAFLIWNLGANYAPLLSGFLVGFLLANSETLFVLCNSAGIAVSLCVVAVWCFIRERFIPVGILCLAISLAVKPQDAGLVWLYFLLAGGVYRKRALQSLFATIALSLPAVLWVWRVAPHWIQEMHSNILAFSVHGGLTDPGPASTGAHGLGMMVNLQTAISYLKDDPHIYNPVSYLIFASLLLLWVFVTLRCPASPRRAWLALASISALSMLPVYHHLYDAKLLLLSVPACAMLWAGGGWTRWLALLLNTAGFVLTADLPWFIVLGIISHLHLPATELTNKILFGVQALPVPLVLLAMGIFYLWGYAQHSSDPVAPQPQ